MAHYLLLHLNGGTFRNTQLLTPAGIDILHAPAVSTDPNTEGAAQYAMGWAVWQFTDMDGAPTALSHGGDWLGAKHIMLIIPERAFGMVLLLNSNEGSAFSNIAWDVALLAQGQAPENFPAGEDWMTRHLRLLSVTLIIILLVSAWIAIRQLRQPEWHRKHGLLFAGLAVMDLAFIIYILAIRLPQNNTTVPLVLRFEPDLGLMLLLQLLLMIGWGSVRSLWAIQRWRSVTQ